VVLVVDRSGSMAGGRIAAARDAAQVFLRSLPVGVEFEVYSFGSRFSALFGGAGRVMDEAALDAATAHVDAMQADYGGTEIVAMLERIAEQHRGRNGGAAASPSEDVILLTDGDVWNADDVFRTVARAVTTRRLRFFTLGIGNDCSTALVSGIARLGRGVAEFAAPGEHLDEKVIRQVRRAFAPAIADARIAWSKNGGPPIAPTRAVPSTLPLITLGDRFVAFAHFTGELPDSATLTGTLPTAAGPRAYSATFPVTPAPDAATALPQLYGRELLRELTHGGTASVAELTAAALEFKVLSKHTAFLAVERRPTPDRAGMQTVVVPQQVPYAPPARQQMKMNSVRCAMPGAGMMMKKASVQMKCVAAPAMPGGGAKGRLMNFAMEAAPLGGMFGRGGGGSGGNAKEAASPATPARQRSARSAPAPPPAPALDDVEDEAIAAPALASPAARDAAGPSTTSLLSALLRLQRASGRWDPTPELRQLLGLPPTHQSAGFSPREATALALAALETRFAARAAAWELVARKARRWLEREGGGAVDEALEEGRRVLAEAAAR